MFPGAGESLHRHQFGLFVGQLRLVGFGRFQSITGINSPGRSRYKDTVADVFGGLRKHVQGRP